MSDIGIGPLNITQPDRVGTLTVLVPMEGGEGSVGTPTDTRELTDVVLGVVEDTLRETSVGKADLDPVVWQEGRTVHVNTKKRRLTQGQIDRVVAAIDSAVSEAYPGVTDAVPPTTGTPTVVSEYPI